MIKLSAFKLLVYSVASAFIFFSSYYIGVKYKSTTRCDLVFDTSSVKEDIDCIDIIIPEKITTEDSQIHLHKMDGLVKDGVLNGIFSMLHHPDMPVKTELIYTLLSSISSDDLNAPYDNCQHLYLTRTGSLKRMPNKCLAITMVESHTIPNPYIQSHRAGKVANLTGMYQPDYIDGFALDTEKVLLPLFIQYIDMLTSQLIAKMGPPILSNGKRRTITIMVANEGVMDLALNFVCSCRAAKLDTKNLIVFLGSEELQPLLTSMGVMTFFHEALGPIPKHAANNYGDNTFGILMWLKTTSIYIATNAGYDILFQDADLVWISDPLPHLQDQKYDIAFMDDGARTPRFTPFFVNSGFYYQKYNERTVYLMEKMMKSICEISMTHSHQATLTRHITEAHHLMDLQVGVLDQRDFPSGMVYHHNKGFIKDIKDYAYVPKVFHMCWTQSSVEKVTYFKDIGMWFLPDNSNSSSNSSSNAQDVSMCVDPKLMLTWVRSTTVGNNVDRNILNQCCQTGNYWLKQKQR